MDNFSDGCARARDGNFSGEVRLRRCHWSLLFTFQFRSDPIKYPAAPTATAAAYMPRDVARGESVRCRKMRKRAVAAAIY